jgi:hypothetical protein
MAEPYCLAMILCDGVYTDRATGKKTILGTFSTVGAQEFPAHVPICIYFAVTDVGGDFELRIRVVDPKHHFDDTSAPVIDIPLKLKSPSPLAVCEGEITGGLPLPAPGVYHCELMYGDELLMSRRLVALSTIEGE